MSRARGRVLVFGGLVIVGAASLAVMISDSREPRSLAIRPETQRPTLLLLTSLPLIFGENFSIRGNGSPVLSALETRYRVVAISVADPAELAKGKLLLMAQPLAQPAEDLLALDLWVHRGGRALVFADPLLEWPSKRQLGDPLRPPPMFMDTGLLAHWGLRLDAPEQPGETIGKLAGFKVATVSPGHLSGTCRIESDGLVAHCRIGRGRATIVADADLLDVPRLGSDAAHNLDGLLGELSSLERR